MAPPEATVHVVFFSTELDGTGELTLTEHESKIDGLHSALGRMGRTSYHAAVEAVVTHHEKSSDPVLPALVIFQTDGAPDTKTPATQALTAAAKDHAAVFFSFIAFGDPENKAFDYLRKLDRLAGVLRDRRALAGCGGRDLAEPARSGYGAGPADGPIGRLLRGRCSSRCSFAGWPWPSGGGPAVLRGAGGRTTGGAGTFL
ncbi:VWA domain-containing protein [Streptomyces sp. NPDC056227]|uniref:VWA domain-containing protein n=1 Tax=unclassified Streptomyces TaxID=2593676 RepID=UPI0035D98284